MGISAVGLKPQVLHNVITDAYLYYIELSGSAAKLVDGNVINDTRHDATGITINNNYSLDIRNNSTNTGNKVIITNNQFNNCGVAVSYYGNNNINTEFSSNTIVNPRDGAVSIDSDGPMIDADFTNNKITFTTPAISKRTRFAFQAYTRLLPSNPAKHNINYANNTIEYASTANSSAPDCTFGIASNNTTINNNVIKSEIGNVLVIHNDNNDMLNLYLTKNIFNGVKNDLSRFNLLANSGNVITN